MRVRSGQRQIRAYWLAAVCGLQNVVVYFQLYLKLLSPSRSVILRGFAWTRYVLLANQLGDVERFASPQHEVNGSSKFGG